MNLLTAKFDIDAYISAINEKEKTNDTTEHSYRGALESLLGNILNDGIKKEKDKISVINEPKRKDYGAPDFEFKKNNIPIAFLETKPLGCTDLRGVNNKKHKSQFDRYKRAVNTIVFTDYLTFILYENGEETLSATIGEIQNNQIISIDDEQQKSNFLKIVSKLGNATPQSIKSAKLLAETMASKAKLIADVLVKAMKQGSSNEDEELYNKLDAFQKFLVHDMTIEQFTDFYAQTIVYGLLVARIYDKTPNNFSLQEAADLIPAINPFLKKIFKHLALADLHSGIRWIVEDLVSIFKVTDINRVMRNYGKDPLVHFYEEFLEDYNPKIREDFGVWYTPKEVVLFIVNAIDIILRNKMGINDGLADNSMTTYGSKAFHKVQILDPATGTGTFLAVTAEKIYENYKGQEGLWPEAVVEHIIPRLNGFEYLMAPYTMAHLKVAASLHLDEIHEKLPDRLQIFLTNSLEEEHPEEHLDFAKFITDESNAASRIKRETPVMVVMGNPPYNEKSANDGEWIMYLMDDYKQEPGQTQKILKQKRTGEIILRNSLDERNPKGINNDYCKFIRLGQSFVDNVEEGVLAYICANTFLDTRLFRGMRYELMKKFDEIYIINLHGSTKRKESTEEVKDECVFDIKVGVSINIFIKHKNAEHNMLSKVYYKDLYGTRKEKFEYLTTHNFSEVDFVKLSPSAPLFTFRSRNMQLRDVYNTGFNIGELMVKNNQGFKTDRDSVAIHYNQEKVLEIVQAMLSDATDEQLREKYGFCDNRDWKLNKARKRLSNWEQDITRIMYRPFDIRWTLFNKALVTYPRQLLLSSVHNHANMVLCLGKEGSAIGDKEWTLVYISNLLTDINVIPRGGVYLFPLFVYDKKGNAHINFSPKIVSQIESIIGNHLQSINDDERKDGGFLAIDLLDYIYAVLHSSIYRKTYHECLQDGFPTIPYPKTSEYFFQIADLGQKLRRLHLLEGIQRCDFITTFPVCIPTDNNLCKKRVFEKLEEGFGRIWINDYQYFDNVPTTAWNAIISGYQPLDLWLKNRKNKFLTNDEIIHYQKMIVALTKQGEVINEIERFVKV